MSHGINAIWRLLYQIARVRVLVSIPYKNVKCKKIDLIERLEGVYEAHQILENVAIYQDSLAVLVLGEESTAGRYLNCILKRNSKSCQHLQPTYYSIHPPIRPIAMRRLRTV